MDLSKLLVYIISCQLVDVVHKQTIVRCCLRCGTNFSGKIWTPQGGSKNVQGGPRISVKSVPRGPYFVKNWDQGVQI